MFASEINSMFNNSYSAHVYGRAHLINAPMMRLLASGQYCHHLATDLIHSANLLQSD